MITIQATTRALETPTPPWTEDEAQVAAAAFLARYSGRTLEAYRSDLRHFFQWAAENDLSVLEATRPHIELYRSALEARGLAASTIDRRLTTVCGFYRFAHIDGRMSIEPGAVRAPTAGPPLRRPGTGSLRARHVPVHRRTLRTTTTRLSPCSSDSTGCASARRAQPTSRTSASNAATERCGSSARATSQPRSRWCPAPPGRSTSPSANAHSGPILRRRDGERLDRRTAYRWVRSIAKRGRPRRTSTRTCFGPRSSWPPSTPASRCETSRSQPATPTPEPPPSTTTAARTSTATPPTSSSPS